MDRLQVSFVETRVKLHLLSLSDLVSLAFAILQPFCVKTYGEQLTFCCTRSNEAQFAVLVDHQRMLHQTAAKGPLALPGRPFLLQMRL